MNLKNIRRIFPLPLYVYLSYIVVCTLMLIGISFSRYVSIERGSDSARVAAGSLVVTHDSISEIALNRTYDDSVITRKFNFYVSNKASEVAIRYNLIVKLNESLPNGVTMTLDGKIIDGNTTSYTFNNAGIFEAGKQQTNMHTLSITGDYALINKSSERNITISVQAEQID